MAIDTRTLRATLGQFVTGVTVIAMEVEGGVRAMTANSFTSVSLDPPLVLFCVSKDSKIGQSAQRAFGFSVNILSQAQREISTYFAGAGHGAPSEVSFVPWVGGPRLIGCVAALGCELHAVHDGGDHWIVVGRVLEATPPDDGGSPLVFFSGRYVSLR